jgi:hypothetical protein
MSKWVPGQNHLTHNKSPRLASTTTAKTLPNDPESWMGLPEELVPGENMVEYFHPVLINDRPLFYRC